MARTTTQSVQELLTSYNYSCKVSLTPFIATASNMVDRVIACASTRSITITDTTAELLERWLSAFYYLLADLPYKEKWTGKSRAVFQGQTGKGFEANFFGQTALSLDPSGCLRSFDKATASVAWLGKTIPEQIDYDDRN